MIPITRDRDHPHQLCKANFASTAGVFKTRFACVDRMPTIAARMLQREISGLLTGQLPCLLERRLERGPRRAACLLGSRS